MLAIFRGIRSLCLARSFPVYSSCGIFSGGLLSIDPMFCTIVVPYFISYFASWL